MITDVRLRELLQPYAPDLALRSLGQLRAYLDLLMRWNEKINLTAIRNEEEAVTRHFGESLFLAQEVLLKGRLLDIGSGAGFPGLALKIAFPDLCITLLEPVAKKRAFLKEVIRTCDFEQVEVRSERLEDFVAHNLLFDGVTARAVGKVERLIEASKVLLSDGGRLILWLSRRQAEAIKSVESELIWVGEALIPESRERVILIATRRHLVSRGTL